VLRSNEALKSLSEVGSGKACPLPGQLGGWERVSSPSRVRGGAQPEMHFWHILGHRTEKCDFFALCNVQNLHIRMKTMSSKHVGGKVGSV